MVRFGTVERERQAKFREHSQTISDDGRRPTDDKGQRNDHLLALGHESENLYPPLRGDYGARKFFAERRIKWHRTGSRGSGDNTGDNGPSRNLASSQVMCVNFFMPLAEIDGALTAALQAIDEDVDAVVDILHEGRRARVEFEWIGYPLSLEDGLARGEYNTNVDAFVIVATKSGTKRAYLMEWKYVENGRNTDYSAGSSGETRRRRYSGLYHAQSSSFNHTVPMNDLMCGDLYQLMRNRLLADRMVANKELGVSDAKVVLVIPDGNVAFQKPTYLTKRFPDLGKSVSEVFSATLKEPDKTFTTVSPTCLLKAVEGQCGAAVSEWATYMRERYGL